MSSTTSTTLQILCEFWQEDGVWNAVTKNLPIAVFGDTFEEAQVHMRDAIQGHLQTVIDLGRLSEVERVFKAASARTLSVEQMQTSRPVVKMSVEVKDNQVAVG